MQISQLHQLHQKTAIQYISEINDEKDLKHTEHLFFSLLLLPYMSESKIVSASDEFFCNFDGPRIDPELAKVLEHDISVKEITEVIGKMQSGKSPGPDGYPSEFFKTFSVTLASLSSRNHSLQIHSPQHCERQPFPLF